MAPPRETGLAAAERFYSTTVAPRVVGIPHAAALIGPGSEVLGFDDATSEDHDFGTRVQLFAADAAGAGALAIATESLRSGTIETWAAPDFFAARLGFDAPEPPTFAQWLATPTQVLAELTGGGVFHDDDVLAPRRANLKWYPEDVWRLVLAAAWLRVAQHQPLHGRAGLVGDALSARVMAARLAHDAMRLTFLIERRWAPYDKWLGTALRTTALGEQVESGLEAALAGRDAKRQAERLNGVFGVLGDATNSLDLAPAVPTAPVRFWSRDIWTIGADRFTLALTAAIRAAAIRDYVDEQQLHILLTAEESEREQLTAMRFGGAS